MRTWCSAFQAVALELRQDPLMMEVSDRDIDLFTSLVTKCLSASYATQAQSSDLPDSVILLEGLVTLLAARHLRQIQLSRAMQLELQAVSWRLYLLEHNALDVLLARLAEQLIQFDRLGR